MHYIIGTDEAGYGPNLGPLVISATLWEVPSERAGESLYDVLREVVADSAADGHATRVALADSKVLYSPGNGLALLERGLLATLALSGPRPTDWRALWESLDADSAAQLDLIPWHSGFDAALPLAADPDDLLCLVDALEAGFARAEVRLAAIASRAIFPGEFNRLTEEQGNKAEALSRATLELVARLMERLPTGPVHILCDKHGGRNRYGCLLQRQFPDRLVEVHGEAARESVYRWGPTESRIEIRFRAGGEEFLPVALASMASKYLRELSMLAFNRFWCDRVPQLRPTAGYPVDSRRFKQAIETVQSELGIEDGVLWRKI